MFNYGGAPTDNTRSARLRGRIGGTAGAEGIAYPSPFFDLAQTYLPSTVKQMFQWCRFYYLTNALIATVVNKMAEYPITDIVLDTDSEGLKSRWENYFERDLYLRSALVDIGLFYQCYGNAIISLSHPFVKWLKCGKCKTEVLATQAKYTFRSCKFYLNCKHCGHDGDAEVRDQFLKTSHGTRLILWNPEDIDIYYNELTAETTYYYSLPGHLKNAIMIGKREIVDRSPQVFIDAVRKQKAVVLDPDNVYHMRRPSILTGKLNRGWGTPPLLPVLKDTFYLQVMKKAQECVSPETFIETSRGLVSADDVRIGDLVRTHTGRWFPVEDKWYRDAKEGEIGCRITTTGLRPLSSVYSPNHPVFTICRNGTWRRKDTKEKQRSSVILRRPHLYEEALCPAEQVEIGDYLLYPRRLPTEPQEFDVAAVTGLYSVDGWVYSGGCSSATADRFAALERGEWVPHDSSGRSAKKCVKDGRTLKRSKLRRELTEDLAYILGWYAGDGSVGTGHVNIAMALGDDDKKLSAAVEREFGLTAHVHPAKHSQSKRFDFCDVIITKFIKGVLPGTARKKAVPISVLNGPDSTKLAFLRGLWESDGCVSGKKASLATSSTELAYGAFRLLLHFGCIASIGDKHTPSSVIKTTGQVIPANDGYTVSVCNASMSRLLALWAGEATSEIISGKSGFFWKDYFAARVSGVEEVEERTYIDFKVAEDTTFCTPGVATKNSVLLERLTPFDILSPGMSAPGANPYELVNLKDWREHVMGEIMKWRVDSNYLSVMPIPVQHQRIGGDGRALLLNAEMRQVADVIIAGLGAPPELIFGGVSWSGSNVSLRMLENTFLRYLSGLHRMVRYFIVRRTAAHLDWPEIDVRFKPFKMADDLQRKAYLFQMNQAKLISDTTLLQDSDFNPVEEDDLLRSEVKRRLEGVEEQQLAEARIAGKAGVEQAKWQAKAQMVMAREQQQMQSGKHGTAPGEPGEGAGEQGVSPGPVPEPGGQFQQMVERIRALEPDAQQQVLSRIAAQNSQLAAQIQSQLNPQQPQEQQGSANLPLPEQKPPRREAALI